MAKYVDVNKPVVELYTNGIGVCEIGKRLGVSRMKVLRTLKENNIVSERITRPYKNFFNINFFSEYNEKSCYWAGFIMADGNIHSKRKVLCISLASVDKAHLEKFKSDINFTGPISDYTGHDIRTEKDFNYSKITIGGKWFANDLEKNFNVTAKKTFTTTLPNIPSEFIPAFIRGYFDGDGSIENNGNSHIVGTYELLSSIQDFFYKNGIKVKGKTGYGKITPTRSIYSISYNSKNADKFLDIIYGNSKVHLDRKYNKYLSQI
jgi:hypothetical protein